MPDGNEGYQPSEEEVNTAEPDTELRELVGKQVIIKETERTKPLGIANGPGFVESVGADNKIRVIYTDKTWGGPAGPFDLELADVEIKTERK